MINRNYHRGFTLIELAVVLAVIGLVVGGVLVGRTLIRASELQSVSNELQLYQTSLNTFKEKYFAWPGDMRNAAHYWGAAAGGTTDGPDDTCSALDSSSPSTGTATCNGNGDGLIGTDVNSYYEMLRAWQQLANAGLITGNFTGVPGASTNEVIGSNVPASRLPNAGWMIYGLGYVSSNNNIFFAGDYGNTLTVGPLTGASMSAEEAFNIDTKLDDGLPQSGFIRSYRNATAPDCITATEDAYNLQDLQMGCLPIFMATR